MAKQKDTEPGKVERKHRATFARDKRKGGFIVRVEGPNANAFSHREVPVTKKDGSETPVTLTDLIWTGADRDSGKPIALYGMVPTERNEVEDATF